MHIQLHDPRLELGQVEPTHSGLRCTPCLPPMLGVNLYCQRQGHCLNLVASTDSHPLGPATEVAPWASILLPRTLQDSPSSSKAGLHRLFNFTQGCSIHASHVYLPFYTTIHYIGFLLSFTLTDITFPGTSHSFIFNALSLYNLVVQLVQAPLNTCSKL